MQEKGPINKTLCLHIRFCRSDEKAVIVMFIAMFQLFWSTERYFREYESLVWKVILQSLSSWDCAKRELQVF